MPNEMSNADSVFELSFGLGVRLGDNFQFDGVVNEDILYTGPNFITGEDVSNDALMTRVSVWGWW